MRVEEQRSSCNKSRTINKVGSLNSSKLPSL